MGGWGAGPSGCCDPCCGWPGHGRLCVWGCLYGLSLRGELTVVVRFVLGSAGPVVLGHRAGRLSLLVPTRSLVSVRGRRLVLVVKSGVMILFEWHWLWLLMLLP